MTRDQIRPATKITANQALGFSRTGRDVEYIEPGTKGTILRVEDEKGWTNVEVLFEGIDHIYHCDLKAAEFAFSTKGN